MRQAVSTRNPNSGLVDSLNSHQDRVYSAEQYSNTVSVTDPVDNKLLGTIRLGDPLPGNLSPLYKGQVLVHGMGFSPDHRTIAVVAIGSNSVNFIDTATNSVKRVTYIPPRQGGVISLKPKSPETISRVSPPSPRALSMRMLTPVAGPAARWKRW
jgi:DNA-binding beta-propeller fold protein YncE